MQGWEPEAAPGYGWPLGERAWINPSPNVPMLASARCYPGTVMVEGTTLSEGRGTTRPFELVGAPDIDADALIAKMHELAPKWLRGCRLRTCWFEPTFQKHVGKLCAGVQIHVEDGYYRTRRFARGACRRSRSRRCARSSRSIRCGATFPTSTSAIGSRSTC